MGFLILHSKAPSHSSANVKRGLTVGVNVTFCLSGVMELYNEKQALWFWII